MLVASRWWWKPGWGRRVDAYGGDDWVWEPYARLFGTWCQVSCWCGADVCSHTLECVGGNDFRVCLSDPSCLFVGLRLNICDVVLLASCGHMSKMFDKVETVFERSLASLTVVVGNP